MQAPTEVKPALNTLIEVDILFRADRERKLTLATMCNAFEAESFFFPCLPAPRDPWNGYSRKGTKDKTKHGMKRQSQSEAKVSHN
ncbi:hypothetical protein Tco_0128006 [Tanacetum coccineum]